MWEFKVPRVALGEAYPDCRPAEWRCVSTLQEATEQIDSIRLIIAEASHGISARSHLSRRISSYQGRRLPEPSSLGKPVSVVIKQLIFKGAKTCRRIHDQVSAEPCTEPADSAVRKALLISGSIPE